MQGAIEIWEWSQAPEEFKTLSCHGGDEEGIAFVPQGVQTPHWLENLWRGNGEPQIENTFWGTVYIWAHA
jgi:hypothetical protein